MDIADIMAARPWERLADCEYTAPCATTEAVDCWNPATKRHVRDGITAGVFCDEHNDPADGVKVEDI